MDCACSIDVEYEGEPYQHYHYKDDVIARRDRTCSDCGGVIPTGQTYSRFTCQEPKSEGGEWHRYITCPLCREIGDCLFCGPAHVGRLWEEIKNEAEEIGPDYLATALHELSPAAGKLLCEKVLDDLIAEADEDEEDE